MPTARVCPSVLNARAVTGVEAATRGKLGTVLVRGALGVAAPGVPLIGLEPVSAAASALAPASIQRRIASISVCFRPAPGGIFGWRIPSIYLTIRLSALLPGTTQGPPLPPFIRPA